MTDRPYTSSVDRLKAAGLRPTRQRLGLARLLFDGGNCHLSAEALHSEARDAKLAVSLATVYNTLHQFTEAGLLREVVVESGRSYFDTNVTDHHHFYNVSDGTLRDIPADHVVVQNLPAPPRGEAVERVDVIVRVRNS